MFGWLVGRIVYEEYDPSLLHPTLSILMLSMVCCPSVWRYTGVVYFFGGDEGDSVVTIGGLVSKSMGRGRMGRALSSIRRTSWTVTRVILSPFIVYFRCDGVYVHFNIFY